MNDAKRTKRLQQLIRLMKADTNVANRDLKLVLTEDEWSEYQAAVEQQRDMKEIFDNPPRELDKYVTLLKRADLLSARAEATYSKKGKAETYSNLLHQSETAYERALEYLAEAIDRLLDVPMWLDREFHPEPEKTCRLEPQSVPRLITSASHHRNRKGISLTIHKRQLKLDALQDSLKNLKAGKAKQRPSATPTTLPRPKARKPTDASKLDFD